jgi:Family of unknown function (DUF6289)
MKLTKNLRMFGIAMALIGITAVQSFALPANEKETVYFSDATMTNEVGYEYRGCNGGVSLQGRRTRYAVASFTSCHTSGPIEMACYFDGRLTMCPLNICDSGLVTCY